MSQNDGTAGTEYPDYTEHGRQYGSFGRGRYLFPIDEREKDRLDIFHRLIITARGGPQGPSQGTFYDVPLPDRAHVLDLGTGTGIWAIDVGDKLYKSADNQGHVLGLDLSLIQPKLIPTCVRFERADVEAPLSVPEQTFDLVHIQMMLGSIRDWPDLYRKSFRHIRPGGYIEQVEIEWIPRSDDNSLATDSPLAVWGNTLRHAMQTYRQPIDILDTTKELRAAGFTDITEKMIRLPTNPWSQDPFEQELGRWFNLGLTHCLEGLTLAPFIQVEGWPRQEVDRLVEDLKKDICRLNVHAYCRM
ncbi:methyltransferase domain-containing protein [Colletotrichum orchidophilum]|uniref:Methyltransferase domain-containing protein n=1 Tax=Colletotrichum orchidophilum TaxID=1209926 RepID=A0A1G4B810_9PEZI|nr:methyltransferase domain-containing protein [Colletotrichum orchidophilum]OHE97443.1 methyltransferase domain-containing protein [Colletotrichum orchidophilum]